jgi:hypothetical protein
LAKPDTTGSLSPEIIIEIHIISESQCSVVDLQKISEEFVFSIDQGRDLLKDEYENLGDQVKLLG